MRQIEIYLILLFCCIVGSACSFGKDQNQALSRLGRYTIDYTNMRNVEVKLDTEDFYNNLDEYLRITSFVKLASEPLLAPIKNVQIVDGHIYVLDRMNRLVCYDMQGKVLFDIDAMGNGPGEYAEISTFTVDTGKNELVLYDNSKTSLFFYTLNEGFYKRTERFMKPNPSEMVFHNGAFFFNNRHHKNYPNDSLLHYSLLVFTDFKIMNGYCFPHNDDEENYIFSPSLQTFNMNGDILYYCKNFDSKIYNVNKDSVICCYNIHLPNPLPVSKIKEKEDERKLLESDYSFGISHVYESDGLLYFRFYNGGYFMNTFYDLENDKQICCVKALQGNSTNNVPVIDVVNGNYEGRFYSILSPDFIDYKKSMNLLSDSTFFQEYDGDSENPVIAFFEVIKNRI